MGGKLVFGANFWGLILGGVLLSRGLMVGWLLSEGFFWFFFFFDMTPISRYSAEYALRRSKHIMFSEQTCYDLL